MRTPLRWLSYLSLGLSLALMTGVAVGTNPWLGRSVVSSSATNAIHIADPVVSLGEVSLGLETLFTLTITNSGDQPIRLVGAPGICVHVGCTSSLGACMTIAPKQSSTIQSRFKAINRGAIDLRGELLFDVGTGRVVVVPYQVIGHASDKSSPS